MTRDWSVTNEEIERDMPGVTDEQYAGLKAGLLKTTRACVDCGETDMSKPCRGSDTLPAPPIVDFRIPPEHIEYTRALLLGFFRLCRVLSALERGRYWLLGDLMAEVERQCPPT